ncbi:MAG: branched-chain amino acid ABC transporter permease [Spirochaetaceae bacterium]|nr:MAG: branched-chain amino acid ABC transporter permease [Spirochaetaceae bacterium]
MADFFQHFINGLTLGGIYAIIALGYTMVYGILKFINFAHGEVLMSGTYIGLFAFLALTGDSTSQAWIIFAFAIALLISMTTSALLGFTIERIAYRPLRRAKRLTLLLTAIGVSIILMNLSGLLFGTHSRRFPYPFPNQPIKLGLFSITPHQILILVVCLVVMILLKLFIDKTRMGKAMRATSLDFDVARLMGIDANKIISLTFVIGSALAGIAGVLIALDFTVYPTMGVTAGLKAFIAAVIGGIGSISGAMVGGILLGLLETFGVAVIGIPVGMRDIIAFSALIIILLLKPEGLFGKRVREKV